jgi:hypothetical protein
VAVLALVAVDLLWTARRTVWTGPGSLFREPALAAKLLALRGSPPARLFRIDKSLKASAPRSRSYEDLVRSREWELETLKSNLSGAFGLEEASGYGAVELRRWRALMDAFESQPEKVANVYGASLLLRALPAAQPGAPVGEVLVAEPSLGLAVTRNPGSPPRLRAVARTSAVADLDEAIARLKSAGFDWAAEAVVEGGASKGYGPAEVGGVELGPRSARARVVAPAGGAFLVFATSFYPGWGATVDGREVPVRATNAAVMGLEVPEGDHRVELSFTDPGFSAGLAVTLGGVLLLGLLWVLAGRLRSSAPGAPARG